MSKPVRPPVRPPSWLEQLESDAPDVWAALQDRALDTPVDYKDSHYARKHMATSGIPEGMTANPIDGGDPKVRQGDLVFTSDRDPTSADSPSSGIYWYNSTTGELFVWRS